jgi:hypothetical protein
MKMKKKIKGSKEKGQKDQQREKRLKGGEG